MIEKLPADTPSSSLHRIAAEVERAHKIARVQQSIDQIDRGEGIPHEEIDAMIDGWLDKETEGTSP